MFKAVSIVACALTLLLAAGCGNACLTLADQICSCQPDDNSKQLCNAQAKVQEETFPVSKHDEATCQQKLDDKGCDCNLTDSSDRTACCDRLNTPQGRAACGLVLTSP
jgi:hypothetical protein